MKIAINYAYAISIVVLPVAAAVLSSFNSMNRIYYHYFYNKNAGHKSVNRLDYVYVDPIDGKCFVNTNSYCRAIWFQYAVPSTGDSPSSTSIIQTITTGEFFYDDGTE